MMKKYEGVRKSSSKTGTCNIFRVGIVIGEIRFDYLELFWVRLKNKAQEKFCVDAAIRTLMEEVHCHSALSPLPSLRDAKLSRVHKLINETTG